MTWATDLPHPLILYPAQTRGLVNWDFEAALGGFGAGLDWGDNASTGAVPVRITTDAKIGSACLQLACASGPLTSATKHRTTITAKYKTGGAEPFYLYFWAKYVSGTTGASGTSLAASLRFTDGSGTLVGSATTDTFTTDEQSLSDSGWHLLRVGPLAAPTWADVTYLEVRFTATSTAGAACEWRVDGVSAAHALDWQDIADPGPGYFTQFEIDGEGLAILNRSEDGSVEGVEQAAKLAFGKFKSTPFDDTFAAEWQQFTDYASDRSTLASFTLIAHQDNIARDYIACCLMDQDDDGLTQHKENTLWDGELSWRETPDSTVTAPRHLWVIEIQNAVDGTDSLYFTTADTTGCTGANVYGYLDVTEVNIGPCAINPLDGSTEWPDCGFSVLDYGAAITTLLIENEQYIGQNRVILYDGLSSQNFSAFTARYTAKIQDQSGDGMRLRFQLDSIFGELDGPIEPPNIGCFEIAEDITDPTDSLWAIKNPVNIVGGGNLTSENRLDEDEASFESGADAATPTGWTTPDGTPKLLKQSSIVYRPKAGSKVMVNTANTGADAWYTVYAELTTGITTGAAYEFGVYVLSDVTGCADAFELKIEAYDSGPTLLDSVTTGVRDRIEDQYFPITEVTRPIWTRYSVIFPAIPGDVAKLRFIIKSNNLNATNKAEFDLASVYSGGGVNLFMIGNEVCSYSSFAEVGDENGLVSVGGRGLVGSLQKKHRYATDGEKEAYLITLLRGHFCDIARRLITTSLWTQTGAWSSGTNYNAESVDPLTRARVPADAVTDGGYSWRCIKDNDAVNTDAPAEGPYWTIIGEYDVGDGFGMGHLIPDTLIDHDGIDIEKAYTSTGTVGQLFDGYDFTDYKVDYRIIKKIDSLSAFLQQMMASFFANMYITSTGKLSIKIHRAAPTGSGNTLTASTLMNGNGFFEHVVTKDMVVNRVVYRMDQDDLNSCDVEGDQGAGSTKFLREFVFNETDFGHDVDSTVIRSLTRHGIKELVIDAPGVRGSRTSAFGMGDYFDGDQIAYEVARRILTWFRFPLQKYTVDAFYATKAISAAEYVTVSSRAMVNMADATNPRVRSASVMLTTSKEYKAGEGRMGFELLSVGDAVAIRNDSTAAAQSTPGSGAWTLIVSRSMASDTSLGSTITYETTGTNNKRMPVMPKGTTNLAWVTLYNATATAWANSTAYAVGDFVSSSGADWLCIDGHASAAGPATFPGEGTKWTKYPSCPNASGYGGTRMYAWCGFDGDSAPADADYQFVGEIPYGQAEGYFMFISTTAGETPKVWVRLKHLSLDRAETAFSDTKTGTDATPNDHATRFVKKSINQIAADGTRINWAGGSATSRGR